MRAEDGAQLGSMMKIYFTAEFDDMQTVGIHVLSRLHEVHGVKGGDRAKEESYASIDHCCGCGLIRVENGS